MGGIWEQNKQQKVERKHGEGGKSLSLLGIGAVSHNSAFVGLEHLLTCLNPYSD